MEKYYINLQYLIILVTAWMEREGVDSDSFLEVLLALHLQGHINLEQFVWINEIGAFNEV